ncbi:Os03g0805850, partial [Oryza sativa Japonica Group]
MPITIFPCGLRLSRSRTGATGYHWSSQSNRSSPAAGVSFSSTARGSGASAATADTGIDSRRRRASVGLIHCRRHGGILGVLGLVTVSRKGSERRVSESRWRETGAM